MALARDYPSALPAEIWKGIFSELRPVYGPSRSLLRTLTVCRWWKALAEPEAHSRILILESRLHLLARRVSTSNAGGWIRTLRINRGSAKGQDIHTLHDYVNTILLTCRGLLAFSWECSARSLTFSVLASAGKLSMRSLKLYLDGKAISYIDRLNDFYSLDTLCLRLSASHAPELEKALPLGLPNVGYLEWSWNSIMHEDMPGGEAARTPEDAAVQYLSHCRFGPQCRIALGLEEATQAQIIMLNPFFKAHRASAQITLHFSKHIPAFSTIMGCVHVVMFDGTEPASSTDDLLLSPALFDQPDLPSTVHLYMNLEQHDRMLWDILNVLERRSSSSPALRLNLSFADLTCFRWDFPMGTNGDDLVNLLMMRLLPYAIRLYAHNVFIVDDEDRGLHEFFQTPIQSIVPITVS